MLINLGKDEFIDLKIKKLLWLELNLKSFGEF